MTTSVFFRRAFYSIATSFVSTSACSSAPSFSGLGNLPGGDLGSAAHDVSADGSVVVGFSRSTSWFEAFRWTEESGIVGLGDLPGGSFDSMANGVSGDGLTIVGSSVGNSGREAFRWTSATGMTGLGDLAGGTFYSDAYGVSFDGSMIGGSSSGDGGQAVRWVSGGPPTSISGLESATPKAVSSDGLTIVGSRSSQPWDEAFRWTAATGIVGLGSSPDGVLRSYAAYAVSSDGNLIVGQGFHIGNGSYSEAFRWTQATGLVRLGDLPGGGLYSYAWDVSADGTYIVGAGSTTTTTESFIWDRFHGMRNLRDFLIAECGVTNLTGWTLSAARGISADGHTIVGDGINPAGLMEAWRVTGIPGPLALTLAASPHGSITGGANNYFPSTTAALTASPSPGYLFTGWTGDATGTDNPLSVLMDSDKTISATFFPDTNDTDDDGFTNYEEIVIHGTNPALPDTDGDGVKDSTDAFPLDSAETLDTDHDGTGDNADTDDDGDGFSDTDEINTYGTNPKLADSDGDGLTDPAEIQTHLTNPNIADTDNDGLSDGAEVNTHGTNPKVGDSDSDGFLDRYEVLTGKLPLDPLSKPVLVAEARTAIEFVFPAAIGKTYRIEDSTDLATWGTVESGIVGAGGQVQRFYSILNLPKRYFRVEENAP